MAGIYIHIPFCRKICSYCDFYKTKDISQKPLFINALINELQDRKNYLSGEIISTIYFGGGTPSVLTATQITKILDEIEHLCPVNKDAEITLEANPDDLNKKYLSELKTTKINRLSIGIQSFINNDLQSMGRRHDSNQALLAVRNAYETGFKNISIDLIYGLPGLSPEKWEENLELAFNLPVKHISAYHLTYHEGTKFYDLRKKGKLKEIKEELSIEQFNCLINKAKENGFIHYEISNFAKEGYFSEHNSSYWFGEKYLGLGPSAHSFDIKSRQWNVASVKKYVDAIQNISPYFEHEMLSENEQYNDYILTNLRTMWGIGKKSLKDKFGKEKVDYFAQNVQKYIHSGHISESATHYFLSRNGYFISDEIMANLMFVE